MADGLTKQVEDATPNPVLVAMKKRIAMLQVLYFVLFGTSLVLIVYNYQTRAASQMHVMWALALGAAVVTRLVRQSMVNKYNALIMGEKNAPLR